VLTAIVVRGVVHDRGVLRKKIAAGPSWTGGKCIGLPQVFEACIAIHNLLRQQDAVDDVDHAVVADNVSGHNSRSIDMDFAISDFHFDQLPIDRRRRGHLHHVCRQMLARDDVVGQDSSERALCFWLDETFDGARWKLRKCGV